MYALTVVSYFNCCSWSMGSGAIESGNLSRRMELSSSHDMCWIWNPELLSHVLACPRISICLRNLDKVNDILAFYEPCSGCISCENREFNMRSPKLHFCSGPCRVLVFCLAQWLDWSSSALVWLYCLLKLGSAVNCGHA
jgi:hypothetical protein